MKEMRCQDIGFDCSFVARAESEEGVMQQVAAHARDAHGIETVPPEVAAKAKEAIHEA
jgi:predicted small metal-binding protein